MTKLLTKQKAQKILHDKVIRGKPLTTKQRFFFGSIAGSRIRYTRSKE